MSENSIDIPYLLDPEKSNKEGFNWYLYFNGQTHIDNFLKISKTFEDVIIPIKKNDLLNCPEMSITNFCTRHIYFNLITNKFSLLPKKIENCHDLGHYLGGFLVDLNKCSLKFIYPDCVTETLRSFNDSFDKGYNKIEINCETSPDPEKCGEFLREQFSDDYRISCEIN